MAYEGGDYSRIENIPFKIIPGEIARYRESVFKERAIVGERLRFAMGLSLRDVGQPAPISVGIEESAKAEKYYEPPLSVSFHSHVTPVRKNPSWLAITAEDVLPIPVPVFVLSRQFPSSMASRSSTRKNVSSVEDARMPAHMMPSPKRSDHARKPVG